MSLYIVSQVPKLRHRGAFGVSVVIVEATSNADALAKAREFSAYIGDTAEFSKPRARKLVTPFAENF